MFGANVALEWETNVYIANRYLGTILIFFYRLIGGFIIVSLFVTVIDESYEESQIEVEQTHANDVFLSNIHIQLHNLQKKLYYDTTWGKQFIPKPRKFALKMENLLKAADLKVASRFHRRSTEERLRDLERMLQKVYSVQKRHYLESVPGAKVHPRKSWIDTENNTIPLGTKVSSMNLNDYEETSGIIGQNKTNKNAIDIQLNTLQEAYEQSKMELNKSKTKSKNNSPSSTNKKKKNNRRLQFRRSNSSGY